MTIFTLDALVSASTIATGGQPALNIVRGNIVQFTATPIDVNGNVVTPASMTVDIQYLVNGVYTTATVTMTDTANVWAGTWDSSVANAGLVFWSMRSVTPSSQADGQIMLTANIANIAIGA